MTVLDFLFGGVLGSAAVHSLGVRRSFGFFVPLTAGEEMELQTELLAKLQLGDELTIRRKIIDICRIFADAYKLDAAGDKEMCSFRAQSAYGVDLVLATMVRQCMDTHKIPRPDAAVRCKCGLSSWPDFMQDQQDGLKMAESRHLN